MWAGNCLNCDFCDYVIIVMGHPILNHSSDRRSIEIHDSDGEWCHKLNEIEGFKSVMCDVNCQNQASSVLKDFQDERHSLIEKHPS